MTPPQKALGMLLSLVAALVLSLIARWPQLTEQRAQSPGVQLVGQGGGGGPRALPRHPL